MNRSPAHGTDKGHGSSSRRHAADGAHPGMQRRRMARAAPDHAGAAAAEALPGVVRRLQDILGRVAGNARLDPAIDRAATVVTAMTRPRHRQVLRGEWLGHAFHPLATDFTEGPWMAASFLDLFGPQGSEPAARRLVTLGLVAAVPTWLSGAMDWQQTRGRTRRVGLLHAVTSTVATALYGASYVARRRGRHRRGVLLGVLGGLVAVGDGYVGGELSLVARVGTGRRIAPTGEAGGPLPANLPDLDTLEDVLPYIGDDVFLRFSRGPEDDRRRTSRDYESGLQLPGLSVVPLAPEPWWDRPVEDWVARQISKYVHLRTEADDDRHAWLLRGRVVSRGPDNEPLVRGALPLARLSDRLLESAMTRYRHRFDVAEDST